MPRSETIKLALAAVLILAVDGWVANISAQDGATIAKCDLSASRATDRRTGKPASSDCGVAASNLARVKLTGGIGAPDERYTAAIFFRDAQGNDGVCTGVLLDTRHVLTAGHCGCGQVGSYVVSFSEFARRGAEITDRVEIEGAPILYDPMVCVRGIAPGKDLALLRLSKSILKDTPRDHGYPIFALTLDSRKQLTPPAPLTVVGYGLTETGGIARRLKTTIPILTATCLGSPYKLYCAQFQEMILADRQAAGVPHDSCEGDSGGPVYARLEVKLPSCDGQVMPPPDKDGNPLPEYENRPDNMSVPVVQNVLVAITSRAAPFTQPLAGGHCGGGSINTSIWRRSVFAWFDANHVRPQRCVGAR
jgi:hypothetical protein